MPLELCPQPAKIQEKHQGKSALVCITGTDLPGGLLRYAMCILHANLKVSF